MPDRLKLILLISISWIGITEIIHAQKPVLDLGIRIQKTVNLYNENGISAQYSHPTLCFDKLYFGFSYVTSRLGTAFHSNAIKQDNYIFSSSWMFRPKHLIRPFARLNTGLFSADYEEAVFDVLPHSSLLLSPEGGVCFETQIPLKISLSLGYNLITGDGMTGPGTLYPLYLQTTISWNVFK